MTPTTNKKTEALDLADNLMNILDGAVRREASAKNATAEKQAHSDILRTRRDLRELVGNLIDNTPATPTEPEYAVINADTFTVYDLINDMRAVDASIALNSMTIQQLQFLAYRLGERIERKIKAGELTGTALEGEYRGRVAVWTKPAQES